MCFTDYEQVVATEDLEKIVTRFVGEEAMKTVSPKTDLTQLMSSSDKVDMISAIGRQLKVRLPHWLWDGMPFRRTPTGLPCYSIANLVDEVVHQWDGKPPGHNLEANAA